MNNQKIDIAKRNTIENVKSSQLSVNPAHSVSSFLLIIFLTTLSSQANADKLETAHATVSHGVLSQELNDDLRSTIIEQSNSNAVSDQISGKATGKTRNEILRIQQAKDSGQITNQSRSLTLSISSSYAPEFTIYNAFTTLQDDFDKDGFYRTFSVVFDADMYSYDSHDISEVYALLYLSENGGPWFHYYTTNDFIIHSDSDQDTFEVITTFMEGYHPGHYDLLIDLYQVGCDHIVATYSSDDSDALYALPLESADHDQVYVDAVYIHHGGSLSTLLLIMLFLLLVSRLAHGFSHRFKM